MRRGNYYSSQNALQRQIMGRWKSGRLFTRNFTLTKTWRAEKSSIIWTAKAYRSKPFTSTHPWLQWISTRNLQQKSGEGGDSSGPLTKISTSGSSWITNSKLMSSFKEADKKSFTNAKLIQTTFPIWKLCLKPHKTWLCWLGKLKSHWKTTIIGRKGRSQSKHYKK